MAPKRKSRSVYKRFASPDIDSGSLTTAEQRKRSTKKLGPQWTRSELERFYYAYRKHPGDWKKIAAAVRNNRSVAMVEALYRSTRAYLSMPEGAASVAGFITMVNDQYIEGRESEREGHDASGVLRKHQKCTSAKVPYSSLREGVVPSQSVASAERCLLSLRQTRAYGIERRACRKRTPRVVVGSTSERDDREGSTPPNKRAKKQRDDDYGSRREGGFPYTGLELNDSTPTRAGKVSQAKEDQSEYRDRTKFGNGMRTSQEEAEGDDFGYNRESRNASEELRTKPPKGMVYVETSKDEFEALQALTELSLPQAGLMESEPPAQLKEDRILNKDDEEPNTPETISSSLHREKAEQAGLLHSILATDNRKPTSVEESVDGDAVSISDYGTLKRKRNPKVLDIKTSKESIQDKSLFSKELAEDVSLKNLVKARRAGQSPAKLLEIAKTSKESSLTSDKTRTGHDALVSATQFSCPGPESIPQKPPNRRKMSLKKSLQERAETSKPPNGPSETVPDKPHRYRILSDHELLKEKVSTCLSHTLVRRRCIYEWFYSAIDYPWFAKTEFTDYVNHVGLGQVQRLTRPEWSVIRSSLGRPKRFSESFIQKERDKLEQYRESVRKHYTELRAGTREGLPVDFAQPLSAGNRVIAIHPKTREICDGKILNVDHNKCEVLFDDSSVELVMDIDCMPLNPLEYMPEGLRRQIDKCLYMNNGNSDASVVFAPSVLDNAKFSMDPPVNQDNINESIFHATDQYITTNNKGRGTEIHRALMLQQTSDALEMEPEMIEIFSGSKLEAQAMVDAVMKAVSSMKRDKDAGNMVQQSLSLNGGEHQPLFNSIGVGIQHQGHSNGSLGHHQETTAPMTNGLISQVGSGKNEKQMTSELISSCVATWLMIQMCTEKKYPPGEVAQLIEKAVSGLQPRCYSNMPIYREIQTCMGWISTRIMALVRT